MFTEFITSCDVQSGSKISLGCRIAIYTVRKSVDRFIEGGSTVNILFY